MKKTIIYLLSLLTVVSCYDDGAIRDQLQALEDSFTGLVGTVIASVNNQITSINASIDQLKDVDAELQNSIENLQAKESDLVARIEAAEELGENVAALERELAAVRAALEDLEISDEAFDNRLKALQSYVDESLKEGDDWAEATFATLEMYDSLQAELTSLKRTVNSLEMDADYLSDQLSRAIASSESSMKAWVNEKLAQGYCDINEVDAELSALEQAFTEADAALLDSVAEQQAALEQAKADLTDEYQKAIQEAIETNAGVLNDKIADAVKTALESLETQVNNVSEAVTVLESRLALLETNMLGRIQSLAFVPKYGHGKATVEKDVKRFTMNFLVKPENLASSLQALWQKDADAITAEFYYATDPATKSESPEMISLNVLSVTASDGGRLAVELAPTKSNPFTSSFWSGESSAMLYLHINDGNNDFTSDLIVLEVVEKTIDLSSEETANCYIVSDAGSYKFKPTKGNSDESVGEIARVEVLWETFGTSLAPSVGDLISYVYLGEDGHIYFYTHDTYSEGNAVIAARNSSGEILWSWHIWLTDAPKTKHLGSVYFSDRNLGATSTIPGDVAALGLLYQWGRKDPFLGSASITKKMEAKSTNDVWHYVQKDEGNGTTDYTIANPTTYITTSSEGDWLYGTNGARWKPINEKTKYDPCPPGWGLPSRYAWTFLIKDYDEFTDCWAYGEGYADVINRGVGPGLGEFAEAWWPYTGGRTYSTGGLNQVGESGAYWSGNFEYHFYCQLFCEIICPMDFDLPAACALAVRCISNTSK